MRRRSIRSKLIGLTLASVGVAVTLSSAVGAWRDSEREAAARAEQLQATASVIASMALEGARENSPAKAFVAIRAIARMPGVTYARVEGRDGGLLAETGAGVRLKGTSTSTAGRPASWPCSAATASPPPPRSDWATSSSAG